MSLPRLERIDAALQALKEEGGKLTYSALRQLLLKQLGFLLKLLKIILKKWLRWAE